MNIETVKNLKFLIGVDLQVDFIAGSLAVKGADEMIERFSKYIKSTYKDYSFIALTMDWHPYNHISFKDFPRHCVAHSIGAALDERVIEGVYNNENTKEKVSVFQKGVNQDEEEFSIFQNKWDGGRLMAKIKYYNPSEIHVCGLVNEFCVFNTVKDLVNQGMKDKIVLLSDFIVEMDNPNVLYDYAKKIGLTIR